MSNTHIAAPPRLWYTGRRQCMWLERSLRLADADVFTWDRCQLYIRLPTSSRPRREDQPPGT